MSVHIGAKKGEIAEAVLLPGDPLRAEFVAERYLQEAECYSRVRGMLGFTGRWKGRRVSVQGTGMGQPSLSIYVNELISEYGARTLVRIGSCGSIQKGLALRNLLIAMSASSDSAMNDQRFFGTHYAPTADPELFVDAFLMAKKRDLHVQAGNVLATDTFYPDDPDSWHLWADYGVLALEMETAALYTLAAKHHVRALTLLTVSDSLITGEALSAADRQSSFTEMVELALDLVCETEASREAGFSR